MRFRKEDVPSPKACQSFRKEGWLYMCAQVVKSGSGIPSMPCFSSVATTEYCFFQNELATGPMTRRNINQRTLEKCINPHIHPSIHLPFHPSIYSFTHWSSLPPCSFHKCLSSTCCYAGHWLNAMEDIAVS